jgi:two-component system response regulator AtoC
VIAATNRDLEPEVRAGRFREDLFYRLNVIAIMLPPLRERHEDIPRLVDYYVATFNGEFRKRISGVSREAMSLLEAYRWPGNIRELRNAVERAMLLTGGTELASEDFPAAAPAVARPNEDVPLPTGGINLEQLERSLVVQALTRSDWNQSQAARQLGLNRDQIRYRIEKSGLERTATGRGNT